MSGVPPTVDNMIIDCDSCRARPRACGDCVVSHLLATAPSSGPPVIDDSALAAVSTLAAAGLVPPLRLLPAEPSRDVTGDARSGDGSWGTTHRKAVRRDIA